jgi:pyruvate-formate lyase-activating enzyme
VKKLNPITTTTTNNYCSQKFQWLSVSPEKQYISSCCAATHTKIDISWLEKNPDQLFNLPILQEERRLMLDNIAVDSCEAVCWGPERMGLPSRRNTMGSTALTHTNVVATPEIVNIILNSDCNLTCSYCNKECSSAWARDINNNGPYIENETRSVLTSMDRIILKLSRPTINSNKNYQLIMSEILKYKDVPYINITGGEPFLFNELPELLANYTGHISIYTGLGVSSKRLAHLLELLPLDRITIVISAENTEQLYEFNRFGQTYQFFLDNLHIIKSSGVSYKFAAVLSNLTIFGFSNFLEIYGEQCEELSICSDPLYLSVNVLDEKSKELIGLYNYEKFDSIIKSTLAVDPTQEQRANLKIYINEFSKRRNLSLEIFPKHFINWINE